MAKLPLYDEIAEARRLVDEANRATMALHKLAPALQSLSILRGTASLKPGFTAPLPGELLIGELAAVWPALAELPRSNPPKEDAFQARLAARAAQLKIAQDVLQPISGEASVRSNTLARLQWDQQQALAEPEWAAEVDVLGELGQGRDHAARRLAPLNQRLTMVEPAMTLLKTFLSAIRAEVEKGRTLDDGGGTHAWRTAKLAQSLLIGLEKLVTHVNLEIPFPDPVILDPVPVPENRTVYWSEVARVSTDLTDLLRVMRSEGSRLRQEADQLNGEYETLTKQILERMG